ncbi:hypothetical protein [uncultured Bacteroides sp.]|uniref:hypothetical protein n=1 Tax=uncultured Bacteroides sp. TaxID=162156 RepID=UPI002AABBFF9|nr:hypothetical protein [uncultured Bacteroides sp.]
MKIEDLISKYFEGATSIEEERKLRRYFAKNHIPEDLQKYKPIFAYFEKEIKGNQVKKKYSMKQRITYTLSGIAAGLLIAISISGLYKQMDAKPDNYVIIDGKKYTDTHMVQAQAKAAFQNVSSSQDDVLATLFNE